MSELLDSDSRPQSSTSRLVRPPDMTMPVPTRVRRHWLVAVAFGLIAAAGAAVAWRWSTPPVSHYVTAAVARGSISRTVSATGTVNPELTIIVGTYVSGVIQQLYCDYNTEVRQGQVCAKIDPRPYQTVVDQMRANLAVAKAQLEKDKAALAYASVSFERNARLVQTSAVSKDAYDSSRSVLEQAQAQIRFDEATIQQRQAALDAAAVNLDYTDIVSPVDGTVVSRSVTIGQTVAASFQTPTLFLIASDLTKMQVDANISESDIGGIKVGQKSTFAVDAFPKRTFEGVVTQVRQSPQTVQNVVTYDIVITVENSDLALKPGLTAATRVIIDRRDDAIRVPNAALRYRPSSGATNADTERGNASVWIIRDGQPSSVAVVTGIEDDNFTEVVSGGLKVDDQVVVAEQRANAPAALRLRF